MSQSSSSSLDMGRGGKGRGEGREATTRNRDTRENPRPRVSGDRQRAGRGVEGERKGVWSHLPGREGHRSVEQQGYPRLSRFVPGVPASPSRHEGAPARRCPPRSPISTLRAPLPRGMPGVVVPAARRDGGAVSTSGFPQFGGGRSITAVSSRTLGDLQGGFRRSAALPGRSTAGIRHRCRAVMTSREARSGVMALRESFPYKPPQAGE